MPVRATVWPEGHDAVSATLVVRYHGTAYPRLAEAPVPATTAAEPVPIEAVVNPPARIKPQLLPMSLGRAPDIFHGQFTPDSVGLWTFRVDGWGDSITTWRRAVTAKLDAGQGEVELSNDLLIGARLLERAATGTPRKLRDPLIEAAEALRTPGDPFTRAGAALSPEVTELLRTVSAARIANPRRTIRRLGGSPTGPFQRLVRDVSALHGRVDQEGQAQARHLRHRRESVAAHRQHGLRRGLPAADPSDRQGAPQGPQQHGDRGARRCRIAVGDRQRRRRPRRRASELGHHRRLRRFRHRRTGSGHGGGAGSRAAVRARPPVGQAAPGMVHRAARRNHRLRREPAEEVSGHLPAELRQRARRGCTRKCCGWCGSGSATA